MCICFRQTPPALTTIRKQKLEHVETLSNGSNTVQSPEAPEQTSKLSEVRVSSLPPDGRSGHVSRINTFQNPSSSVSNYQRQQSPFLHQKSPDKQDLCQQNINDQKSRSFSPFQAYQNHIQMQHKPKERREFSPVPQRHNFYSSPLAQRKTCDSPGATSPFMQRRVDENKWASPTGSPLPLRNHLQDEQQSCNYGNTSPILLQRFYHQQKQQQQAREAEETAKYDNSK